MNGNGSKVDCPYCGAGTGLACRYRTGDAKKNFHPERIALARQRFDPAKDYSHIQARLARDEGRK